MTLNQTIDSVIEDIGTEEDKLIMVLMKTQKACDNYLPKDALKYIASRFKMPLSKVYGVASFYSIIHLNTQPKYIIEICNSAPCHVNGAQCIIDTFKSLLNIDVGEDTSDGIFGLRYAGCFGSCDASPAVKINGEIKSNLDPSKAASIVDDLRRRYDENNQ